MNEKLKEDFLGYRKLLNEHPEIATALKDNKRLLQEIEDNKKAREMLAHDLRNPLSNITGFTSLMMDKETELSEEEKDQYLEIINISTGIAYDLVGLLSLDGLSKEELQKKAEPLILEDLAKNHSNMNNKYMKDEKIGLHLKYNQLPYHKTIEMYANKAAMNAIWGTLFSNSLEWVPALSQITQAFRVNKADSLEIIMENEYAEKRLRKKGMGEGIGTPFVKKLVQTMDGDFCTYKTDSQIRKEYDMDEWWGYKKGRDLKEDTIIYGVKITIPMKELTKSEAQNKEIQ